MDSSTRSDGIAVQMSKNKALIDNFFRFKLLVFLYLNPLQQTLFRLQLSHALVLFHVIHQFMLSRAVLPGDHGIMMAWCTAVEKIESDSEKLHFRSKG